MSNALVLGAGGAVGLAFNAGVVRALEADGPFPPAAADLVVGTSAGAAVAAALRAGVAAADIVAAVGSPPSAEERAALLEEVRSAPRSIKPLAPGLARHALPGGGGAVLAASGLLPPGVFPAAWLERFPGVSGHEDWPEGLWIPAVRADDGSVVVFGRDRRDVPVASAVQASCAVPGMFRPPHIDGVPHLDGGTVSPTHAAEVAAAGVELVVISSPMTRPSRRVLARHARRRLAAETRVLTDAGVTVVVIEPPAELTALARGFPRRGPGAAAVVAAMAEDAARRALRALARTG